MAKPLRRKERSLDREADKETRRRGDKERAGQGVEDRGSRMEDGDTARRSKIEDEGS
jgi:hypothetical protein